MDNQKKPFEVLISKQSDNLNLLMVTYKFNPNYYYFDFFPLNIPKILLDQISNHSNKMKAIQANFKNIPGLLKIQNFNQEETQFSITYATSEQIQNIDIKQLNFMEKMKIIIGIAAIINVLHKNQIYGIDFNPNSIFINQNKEPFIGLPLI